MASRQCLVAAIFAMLIPSLAAAQTDPTIGKDILVNGKLPQFKFSMNAMKPVIYQGGTAKQVTAAQFPLSKSISGVYMTLEPGGLRELHWHANAAEWAYVFEGNLRITVVDYEQRTQIADLHPGGVWYFPRGHGHSIEGLGPGTAKFLLVFDNGYFSEFSTFSITDWIAHTPKDIVARNLGLTAEQVDRFPKKEVYIASGPVPPPLAQAESLGGLQHALPLSHIFNLGEEAPIAEGTNGSLQLVSEKQFPISTTITGAFMRIEPGGIRELHWHPNADEWQFVSKGHMELTVFASNALGTKTILGPGDIGFVPQGFGHALANVGNEPVEAILAFNTGEYQEISLSTFIKTAPRYLLQTNFGLPKDLVELLPHNNQFFIGGLPH